MRAERMEVLKPLGNPKAPRGQVLSLAASDGVFC